ncbi:MAG TPA: hypothetical protein VMG31_13935 [Verrucomicrobiae bacterium]|nr:hypothetical protein [Verrucomicrobiae bacterium]
MPQSVGQPVRAFLLCFISLVSARAASRIHVITLGKWTTASWFASTDAKPQMIKIRPLLVDGRVKEYVLGAAHEVTERLFVVRRAFRVNDSLPEEPVPKWQWQRGGWLLVDRTTGRITPINLPEFDTFYSAGNWYRDYIAYCGVSDDGKSTHAIVAQLGRRKPILKKSLSNAGVTEDGGPDSACLLPAWQRGPVRVSFEAAGVAKQTFAIRGHVVDVINNDEEDPEEAAQ